MKKRLALWVLMLTIVGTISVNSVNAFAATEKSETRMIYGNSEISDEDAFVITVYAEGYKWSERERFFEDTKMFTSSLSSCSPWNEFLSVLKIYGVALPSNESGCRGDDADSYEEMLADSRDTYFKAQFWYSGLDRFLVIDGSDIYRVFDARDKYSPYSDLNVVLVNSKVYGGSGGSVAVASTNPLSAELVFHEAAHTIGGLLDEYYYSPREAANLTQTSDPDEVRWSKFIGKNGIGVYPYEGTTDWYVPSLNCKMKALNVEFCEVCKEALRRAICEDTNMTVLYYQPYAQDINLYDGKLDLCNGLILNKADKVLTGERFESKLTLTYYDETGNKLSKAPTQVGNYSAHVVLTDLTDFDDCSQDFEFTIDHDYSVSKLGSGKCKLVCTDCGKTIIKELTAPEITYLKGKKGSVKLRFQIDDNFASGVQVQYSKSSSFSSGVKTKTYSDHTSVLHTIKKLTSGKKYYVRVRSYRIVNGEKVYSEWSSAKKVKVK